MRLGVFLYDRENLGFLILPRPEKAKATTESLIGAINDYCRRKKLSTISATLKEEKFAWGYGKDYQPADLIPIMHLKSTLGAYPILELLRSDDFALALHAHSFSKESLLETCRAAANFFHLIGVPLEAKGADRQSAKVLPKLTSIKTKTKDHATPKETLRDQPSPHR